MTRTFFSRLQHIYTVSTFSLHFNLCLVAHISAHQLLHRVILLTSERHDVGRERWQLTAFFCLSPKTPLLDVRHGIINTYDLFLSILSQCLLRLSLPTKKDARVEDNLDGQKSKIIALHKETWCFFIAIFKNEMLSYIIFWDVETWA